MSITLQDLDTLVIPLALIYETMETFSQDCSTTQLIGSLGSKTATHKLLCRHNLHMPKTTPY